MYKRQPTAKAREYIVYTRLGHGGFDNGTLVRDTKYTFEAEPGLVYLSLIHILLALIPRISHTEPGNVKGFYKRLHEDLDKEIKIVADEMEKASKA